MGTELTTQTTGLQPLQPGNMTELLDLASRLCKSSLVPAALKSKPEDVLVILLTGREIGFGAMQSLRGINVIQGKGVLGADAMAALVLSRRDICQHLSLIDSTDQVCTYATLRAGAPREVRMSYSLEQARRAGLTNKDNWKNHPEAMLRARCVSAICRAVYPDLVAGLYVEDEGDEIAKRDAPRTYTRKPAAPEPAESEVLDEEPEDAEPETEMPNGLPVTNAQARRIFAIADGRAKALGLTGKDAHVGIVRAVYERMGIANTAAVTPDKYDAVCAAVEAWGGNNG